MRSALSRRMWRELTRRKARSLLTIATLAAAVAGVWLFATPQQLGAAMDERIVEDRIHDVILRPDGVRLDDAALADLRATENVADLDVRTVHTTEMRSGDRVQDVWLIGVVDFADQRVNAVRIESGEAPGSGGSSFEALTDTQNRRSGRYAGSTGDQVTIRDVSGLHRAMRITGAGSTAYYSNTVVDFDPVLYVPIETLWAIAGFDAEVYTRVEFTVVDRGEEATAEAVDGVRSALARHKPSVGYNALPEIRPVGEWPGKDDFDNFLVLFWVVGAISLISAVLLIATTMNTLVREQTREIGVMKAIGAGRRQIAVHFASAAALIGAAGTMVGLVTGALLSNLLVGFSASNLIGVETDWQFSWLAVLLSVVVGMGVTVVASLPAVLRGVRIPVHEAIGSRGIESGFGQGALERGLRRLRFLPRFAQLGLRSAVRQKSRSLATVMQVALAVGTMLGFAAMLITMVEISDQSRRSEGGDISVWSSGPGAVLDADAIDAVEAVEGVARVQPIASSQVLVGDTETFTWGLPADPVYRYELDEGRWFSAEENAERAMIAIAGPALSNVENLAVGESVRIETGAGSARFEVVGIDATMVSDGLALFVPIETLMILKGQDHPTWFWVETASSDHDEIDRVALDIRSTLETGRYGFDYEVRHVEIAAQRSEDRLIIMVIMLLGIPVVAIGMIGLVSTVTMNVIERSREIGVLRSLGASARDVRRYFRAEAVVLVFGGWLIGTALGYLIGRVILRFMNDAFDVDFTLRYPVWPLGVALALTLVVAGVVLARPLRRVGRLSPSAALRYE